MEQGPWRGWRRRGAGGRQSRLIHSPPPLVHTHTRRGQDGSAQEERGGRESAREARRRTRASNGSVKLFDGGRVRAAAAADTFLASHATAQSRSEHPSSERARAASPFPFSQPRAPPHWTSRCQSRAQSHAYKPLKGRKEVCVRRRTSLYVIERRKENAEGVIARSYAGRAAVSL